jgi:hypothetical protein
VGYNEKRTRHSDVVHDRSMQNSLLQKWATNYKFQVSEAYEQMDDFDHKMGLKMRNSNHIRVDDQRAAHEREELTMGIAKTNVPREPSPIQLYEYGSAEPHKRLNLDAIFHESASQSQSYRFSSRSQGATSGASTWRDSPKISLSRGSTGIAAATRGGAPISARRDASYRFLGDDEPRPGTYDSARDIEIVTQRSLPSRLHTARGRLQGLGQGTSDVWTPQSMLEPIFMPTSCAQRLVTSASDDGMIVRVRHVHACILPRFLPASLSLSLSHNAYS